MYCPRCGGRYPVGVTECSGCELALLPSADYQASSQVLDDLNSEAVYRYHLSSLANLAVTDPGKAQTIFERQYDPVRFADLDDDFYRDMLLLQLPEHKLRIDEARFLRLLASSLSLTRQEKRRLIEHVPLLDQEQADQILSLFEEEVQRYRSVPPEEAKHLNFLEAVSRRDWKILEDDLIRDWKLAVRTISISPSPDGLKVCCSTTFTPTSLSLDGDAQSVRMATPLLGYSPEYFGRGVNDALQEFQAIVNDRRITEHRVHSFLKSNPEFLLGVDYRCLHSSVLLRDEREGDRQADFMLEYHDEPYADIIELKRPQDRIFCSIRSIRHLAATTARAIAQLHKYRGYFDSPDRRREFLERHGFSAYLPDLCLVIGRTTNLSFEEMRHMQRLQSGVRIWTYDDLVKRAKQFYRYRYGLSTK